MGKILRSGNVYLGTCGDPTDLYDSNGNNLYVGDLVAVWTQDVEDRGWNDEPTFVVQEKGGKPYIMGLKNAKLVRKYLLDGTPSDKQHCDSILDVYQYGGNPKSSSKIPVWNVIRIKTYDKTAIGEIWDGGVRPVNN